eukprot:57513-Rhodomonas_salina.1
MPPLRHARYSHTGVCYAPTPMSGTEMPCPYALSGTELWYNGLIGQEKQVVSHSTALLHRLPASVFGGNAAISGGIAAIYGGIAAVCGGNAAIYGGNAAVCGGNATANGGNAAIYGSKTLNGEVWENCS